MAPTVKFSFERRETKYLLTEAQQAALLQGMQSYMQADVYGRYTICNLYYDTEDWQLIRASIEKPIFKEKLRVRSYGVPAADGTVFAELKRKCAGTVYKRRIALPVGEAAPFLAGQAIPTETGQIGAELRWFQSVYHARPRVFLGCDREAWAGIDDPELRITFDTGLRFRTRELDLRAGSAGEPLLAPETVLMEIKLPGVCPLWLSHLLSEVKAFPTSYSKYGDCYRCFLREGRSETKKEARYSA